MNSFFIPGLHIYVNTVGPKLLNNHRIFYSQRLSGPYYRWTYEEHLERWSGHRLALAVVPNTLRNASKRVPRALWLQLREHYVY